MLNEVKLIGNLGSDPELRYTNSGKAVCNLSVATTRRVKRDDKWEDETEWHRVTVWEKQAELCNEYLSKGRQVYVMGRNSTRKYEDKDGVTKYTTEVIASDVKFLGKKGDSDEPPARPSTTSTAGAGEGDINF